MSNQPSLIAVTCGEPAGIGPEISVRAAWELRGEIQCALIGDAALASRYAAALDPSITLETLPFAAWNSGAEFSWRPGRADRLRIIDCPLSAPVIPGQLDPRNGHAVLQTLDVAIVGALARRFNAIVTAPLQKSTINDAGMPFTGHTEYLAERTATSHVVMMLAGGEPRPLRVALATTHLALKDVPGAIGFDSLLRTIRILHHDLQSKFGLSRPRILVTGLNPHAGENGYLGREEIDIIAPALAAAQAAGIRAEGPYPADTLFQPKYLEGADCVLAMYHDQGLPVLKHATFGRGVNITLGLPIVRTSVDHGTALDVAASGAGRADHGSMLQAIRMAAQMAAATAAAATTQG